MKNIVVFIASLTASIAWADEPATTCPSGYQAVGKSGLVLQDTACMTSIYTDVGTTDTCLSASPSNGCYMYSPADINYTNAAGTYQFTKLCALSGVGTIATKCVKLSASSSCGTTTSTTASVNWSMICDGISVQAVGVCASQPGSSLAEKLDSIEIGSPSNNENTYCWCKIIHPITSSWVFTKNNSTANACSAGCANMCTAYVSTASFKAALLSGLGY